MKGKKKRKKENLIILLFCLQFVPYQFLILPLSLNESIVHQAIEQLLFFKKRKRKKENKK